MTKEQFIEATQMMNSYLIRLRGGGMDSNACFNWADAYWENKIAIENKPPEGFSRVELKADDGEEDNEWDQWPDGKPWTKGEE